MVQKITYAIGLPGHVVRLFIETDTEERAVNQCEDGEVAVPVQSASQWQRIGADGCSVESGEKPVEWERDRVRCARNQRLSGSDWTQVPDTPLSAEKRAAWGCYRQELRDLTDTQPLATLETVMWPEMPL